MHYRDHYYALPNLFTHTAIHMCSARQPWALLFGGSDHSKGKNESIATELILEAYQASFFHVSLFGNNHPWNNPHINYFYCRVWAI
jgi:hypothetical protein